MSEVEEGRSGQQSTRDDVDASPLVPLLSSSIIRGRDELLSSSLFYSESARRDGEASGVHAVAGQSRSAEVVVSTRLVIVVV